jgi:hypothetical protein
MGKTSTARGAPRQAASIRSSSSALTRLAKLLGRLAARQALTNGAATMERPKTLLKNAGRRGKRKP